MDKSEKKRLKAWIAFPVFIPLSVFIWMIGLFCVDTHLILPAAANSNAKLLFTNTAMLCTKATACGTSVPDGIYAGRLKVGLNNTKPDDMYRDYSPDGINAALNYLIGDHSGSFYCVEVRDNTPVASFWSVMPIPYDKAEDLLGSYEYGTPFTGIMVTYTVSRPYSLGGYPHECFTHEDEIPSYGTSLPVYRSGSVPMTERIKFLPEWVGIINIYFLLCLVYGVYLLINALKHRTKRKER
ncbi:MAG: hypothetical protein J6I96_03500 [Oscillospiraceae bacterium]|nr:hypothetical protein [Oscillospiraceae bacterium]